MKNHLIVIAGPTAIGKTALAVQLAAYYGTEIISADSRQFYKELSIGTAKPTVDEMKKIPHHFINNLSITEDYNAARYETEVMALLDNLFKQHPVVILCGGSGLFIDAVCNGMDSFSSEDKTIREELNRKYNSLGLNWLQEEVKTHDPVYYQQADIKNPQRLLRALEVCLNTGKPYSSFRSGEKKERAFGIIKILLNTDRGLLYERINKRVDEMIEAGLEQEVKQVLSYKGQNALNTVGYKEMIAYLEGKTDLPAAIGLIKQNTRNYAKRQLTWFRKNNEYMMFEPGDSEKIKAFLDLVISH